MSATPAFQIDEVDVYVEGEGAETLLMVHGWPDTYRLWDSLVAHLKPRYRCVRFTLPGFEKSDARKAYTLEQTLDVIDRIGARVSPDQKFTLVLHDWGCVFGYQYYTRHPERVARIVGVDIGDSISLPAALSLKAKLMVFSYQVWLAAAWLFGPGIGDSMTRSMARLAQAKSDPAHIGVQMTYPYWQFWNGSYRKSGMRRFEPQCPMLYIYAKRKPFYFHAPEWIERVAAKPGNRVLPFDTGHWVMLEQPERFNAAVGDWLSA